MHTPGPLEISGPSNGLNKIIDDGGNYAMLEGGHIIGEAHHYIGGGLPYADAEANARLWASAPDLLAACKAALHGLTLADTEQDEIDAIKSQIQQAIAKAEGPHA
jgi:hypothetical protein